MSQHVLIYFLKIINIHMLRSINSYKIDNRTDIEREETSGEGVRKLYGDLQNPPPNQVRKTRKYWGIGST